MKIKNIVFDIGKVLFDYDPDHIINNIIKNTEYFDSYKKYLFEAAIWQDLDKGILSEKEAVHQLKEIFPLARQQEDILNLIQNFIYYLSDIKETQLLFQQFKNTYSLFLLSNFQKEAFTRLVAKYPFLNKVDGMVISGQVNFLKPEPEIYAYLLNSYKLNPLETVFIDDRPENIAAAKKQHINGIIYQNPKQLKLALNQLGVSCN